MSDAVNKPVPVDTANGFDQPAIRDLYLNHIFDNAEFRNGIVQALENNPPTAPDLTTFVGSLRAIVDGIKGAGIAETYPVVGEQIARFETFMADLMARSAFAETITDVDALRRISWPDPTKGRRFGRSILDTVPASANLGILDKSTKIASGGGCFNFEWIDVLVDRGYTYLVKEMDGDPENRTWTTQADPEKPRPQGSCNWGILFNAPAYARVAEMAFGDAPWDPLVIQESTNPVVYRDIFREGIRFADPEAYHVNLKNHVAHTRETFIEADAFILFLGNNEGWEYLPDGRVMSSAPGGMTLYGLLRHHTFSLEDNVAALSRFVDLVRGANPRLKIIIGITPVPLLLTGRADQHVVGANFSGKSVLRVATDAIIERYDDVYYFPSYEAGTACVAEPHSADGRHATDAALERIADTFEACFSSDAGSDSPPGPGPKAR